MKFTTVGPEGARNLLREKQRRNRMAAKELRVQFPELASIRIDFAFSDETRSRLRRSPSCCIRRRVRISSIRARTPAAMVSSISLLR